MKPIATLSKELAEHWLNVLTDAGIECALSGSGDETQLLVSEAQAEEALRLFEPPFEDEEIGDAPTLAPGEHTLPLFTTTALESAAQVAEHLMGQGLFANVLTGASSSVFGADSTQQFTLVVAESSLARATALARDFLKSALSSAAPDEQGETRDVLAQLPES